MSDFFLRLSLSFLWLNHSKSAAMAGLKVVPVKSLPDGSLDLADLRAKAEQHKDDLAAFMVSIASGNNILARSHSFFLDHISVYLRCVRGRCQDSV